VLPFVLSLLLAAAAPPRLVPLSALVKVRPGLPLQSLEAVRLRAARGECEAFQVAVAPETEVTGAGLPPLQGPRSALLSAKVYREAWLNVTRPSGGGGATGLWPDPLLPVSLRNGGTNPAVLPSSSTTDRPVVLFVEVCVPGTAPVGTYSGLLRVTAAGQSEATLPVRLEVAPVQIPATSSFPNMWGLGVYVVVHGHHLRRESPEAVTLLRQYVSALVEHRLSGYGLGIDPLPSRLGGDGQLSVDFSRFDAEMSAVLDGTALPPGARATTVDIRDDPRLPPDQRLAYLRAWPAHFRARGWSALLWYYAKDEPKPKDDALVRTQSTRAREAGGLPVLVTSYRSELWEAADIVAPPIPCFFPRPGLDVCRGAEPAARIRARLGQDRRLFWYQSCMTHGCDGPARDAHGAASVEGWASYMVDHSGPRNRAMGVLAYLAGIDGELYFDTLSAWERDGRPWEDVYRFGGNGDGTFFYPGTPDRIGSEAPAPVTSLRLKTVREGLQDLELLRLVEARSGRSTAEALARRLARSAWDITPDPAVWSAVHGALLDAAGSPEARRP
jgi:hypothetical protein